MRLWLFFEDLSWRQKHRYQDEAYNTAVATVVPSIYFGAAEEAVVAAVAEAVVAEAAEAAVAAVVAEAAVVVAAVVVAVVAEAVVVADRLQSMINNIGGPGT
ncbi:hypothetical protein DPMN_072112, partial [Dreissena polymorpha]